MTNLLLKKSRLFLTVLMLLSLFRANAQQSTNLINAQLTVEREKYGLTADDISDYLITNQYTDEVTGLTYSYIQQRHNKVAVYNAISVFLIKDNKVVYFTSGMIDHLAQKVKSASPNITPEAAIGYALINIGRDEIAPVKLINTDNNLKTFTYESPSISSSPIKVQLVYRAMDDGIYLAWDVSIELKNEPHWWNIRIDALTGNYLDKNDWTVNCSFDDPNDFSSIHEHETFEQASQFSPLPPPPPLGEYNVYAFPLEAPSFGGRSILINPEDPTSSPFGWHDVDGVVGNDYTITRGNNVHAYEDANNDNLPGYSPNTATLQFNYPVDLTQAPLVNQDASITNLFYLNNRIHDVLRHAGFNEAAGNFQQNNYGNGGLGNDYVQAEAFDGGGTNNANFGTPADGSKPRMQMYLWTAPTPDRDGSFDNGIVAHEYGHGVSNRLTGGPSQAGCLGNAEQGGEGWSDWLALIMTIEPGDTVAGGMLTQARGIGTYALNQATTGQGIRRFRYSVNMAINPQTYADLATSGTGPHNKGEIWCDAIWDMTSFLVNDLGFDPNPTIATAGNNIAMRLVLEGMKLQPCSPGFLDARDAILNADAILYSNAHRCRIWEAFARRGMGFSAVQGSSNSSTDQTAAFDMPVFCLTATQPPVAAFTSNVSTIPCAGTVQFTNGSTQAFSYAWNFDDGGTSILNNPTHQFTSPGTYNVKLVVTNPLGTDSVTHPITVTSIFSANLTATPNPVSCGSSVQLNAVGSGSTNYNYALTTIPFAPVSGTPTAGPAGDDIVSSFIPIGFNFPFYNTVQTQLKISTNGFISFNSNSGSGCCAGAALPNNSSTLSNLIAVAWTDLYVGSPNSIDYFNLTSPNRFVIRYNAVSHCCATTPAQVTAQIILYQTGEIEMHNTSILTGGDVMTMGIENANGTIATVVPGRNASNFTASNEGYRFTPFINYTYNWQPGNLNGASQTVSPIANTTYTVSVADGSGCVQPFNTALINVTPIIANISGSLSFCSGSSTILDAGAGYTGYSWSTGATSQTISVSTAGNVSVTVTNASNCTGSTSVTTVINPLPNVTASNVSGCAGSTIALAGSPAGGTWSVANPYSGASTTYTHTFTDGNGCTNTSTSANITVNARPTGVLSGTTTICGVGSTSLSIAATGSGTINGTLNPGAIAYSGTAPIITVSVSPGGLTNYSIATMSDANCSSIAGDLTGGATVSVYTLSTAPTSITSNAVNNQICTGNSILLTANGGAFGNAPGASYKWYEGGCGTGAALGSAATLSLTPTLGSHTYYARIEDGCGNTNCTSLTVLVTAATQLNQIQYTASIADGCVGAPFATFSVNPVAGCTFYNWTSAQSGVRFNGNPGPYQTTVPTINITFVSLPAAGASGWNICVFGGNPCGITNTRCTWVRSSVSAPTAIIGSVIGCPGTYGNNYSSTAVAGAASYQWSSTGGIVVTGNGSQAVTVAFPGGFVSGTLSVRGQTSCGYQGANRTISISRAPAKPAAISGPSYPCPSASSTYSVSAVTGATNYTWTTTVPGAVVTGMGTSCSITFPATIPAGSSVSVVANSSCLFSSAARSKGIASGLLGVPSAISGPASGQCGATGVSYTINPVVNATGYFWTASCGVIQGSNTLSGLTIDWPGSFTSCILTVSANNSCGSGVARTLSVSGAPATPTVVSGNAIPCIGAFETYSASSLSANSFNWTIPAGSTILGPVNGGTILLQWGSTSGNVSAQAVNACGASGFRALACVISCRQSQVTGSASGLNAQVYPNPATEKATVKFTTTTAAQYHLSMTDVIGRNVLSTDGTATEGINMVDLDLNNLAKGVYMLNIMSGNNNERVRVVVE